MLKHYLLFFLLCCIYFVPAIAQTTCTGLGQNPTSAFPVCGTASFLQSTVPLCGGRFVPGPCSNETITDINPYWYSFTCFAAGTLGFTINPLAQNEDYDWQLFDVTGKNVMDIYTDASMFVACDWSGDYGSTGASSAGRSLKYCGGPGVPLFSSMPALIQGHQYILLVSHFSNSQSGYNLTFAGGTASITDTLTPHLLQATASCDDLTVSVKLNKQMKCSSIAADGADFIISPNTNPIIGATGVGCSNSFDMDSVILTFATPLTVGNYMLMVRPNNNLLDNCNNAIPAGDTLKFPVFTAVATPMDSITPLTTCAPQTLKLVFKDAIRCSSIAVDGTDFLVTGPAAVKVLSATGNCDTNATTKNIEIKLSAPIQLGGNYQLKLATGSDGNTITNECRKQTPIGSTLNFSIKDTVSATFTTTIKYGCVADTILFSHDGRNAVNSWQWNFDNSISSTAKDTAIVYPIFGEKTATLMVSNGICANSSIATILLDNAIKAIFESTAAVCPGDPASFMDKSTGSLNNAWSWAFGNGNTSNLQVPPDQYYPVTPSIHDEMVQLIVSNSVGCSDTATNVITVAGNCYIAVPKAFSPNGDGLNDFLYPTNAYKAANLLFRVYNRNGNLVFETRDWTNKWDGTYKGLPQDIGTYVWVLNYTNIDTGKKIAMKGTTVLIR